MVSGGHGDQPQTLHHFSLPPSSPYLLETTIEFGCDLEKEIICGQQIHETLATVIIIKQVKFLGHTHIHEIQQPDPSDTIILLK